MSEIFSVFYVFCNGKEFQAKIVALCSEKISFILLQHSFYQVLSIFNHFDLKHERDVMMHVVVTGYWLGVPLKLE